MAGTEDPLDTERADLLASLGKARHFLRHPARGLSDEQAASSPTVSELCIGGIIKHVAAVEDRWMRFVQEGPSAMSFSGAAGGAEAWLAGFRMGPGDTLAGLLERYEQVAAATDALVASLPDLSVAHPLPDAPWFEKGARWSARRVVLHVVAETAQHAGHADVIREAIDGAKSMG